MKRKSPKSGIDKHSFTAAGKRSSVTLEPTFWECLHDIAAETDTTISQLIHTIDTENRSSENLSSSIRVFILEHFRAIAHKRERRNERQH
jgi:predicted DNA-binding ribbon-helix-helix protein